MSHSLAVRRAAFGSLEPPAGSSLTRVREVLDTLATRDVNGDVLTAVRYFPAREAQWAEFPALGSRGSCRCLRALRAFDSFTRIKPSPPRPSTLAKT